MTEETAPTPRKRRRTPDPVDMTGMQIGGWRVEFVVGSDGGEPLYLARCACGHEQIRDGKALRRSSWRSLACCTKCARARYRGGASTADWWSKRQSELRRSLGDESLARSVSSALDRAGHRAPGALLDRAPGQEDVYESGDEHGAQTIYSLYPIGDGAQVYLCDVCSREHDRVFACVLCDQAVCPSCVKREAHRCNGWRDEDGATLKSIGDQSGRSRENVRQVEVRALRNMLQQFESNPFAPPPIDWHARPRPRAAPAAPTPPRAPAPTRVRPEVDLAVPDRQPHLGPYEPAMCLIAVHLEAFGFYPAHLDPTSVVAEQMIRRQLADRDVNGLLRLTNKGRDAFIRER
jgi:hypothetical protein